MGEPWWSGRCPPTNGNVLDGDGGNTPTVTFVLRELSHLTDEAVGPGPSLTLRGLMIP